ncbi:flagellar hook-length control protein FliK [Mesorhizobium waimense]|uniref:Flagellar hook-length control protein FliK n=1 Tax=Mesorhizobium waimense TaxID=1300307 RepID=A0A3A5KS76_9HYPH|nr:flagellar hook-length control protein FliK [Mesorhizobium waimense]RJT39026.1 flagellar hook-length control protein FliK [Mesorhizobium waimense]
MTTSLGQALPGLVSTRAPSKAAANSSSETSSFDDMVRGTEKPARPEGQPTDRAVQGARWVKGASVNLGKVQPDHEPSAKAATPKQSAGRIPKEDADTNTGKTADDAEPAVQGANVAPLQDRLPLLMALHDIRQFSAAAKTEGSAATTDGETTEPTLESQPPSAQQLSSLKKSRSSSGPDAHDAGSVSKSERTANGVSLPGQLRQPDVVGSVLKGPPRPDDETTILPKDQTATEPASPAKRSAPGSKSLEAIRSAMPSEQGKQATSAARIDVVAEQSFPAPAQSPMSQTTSVLIDAIASDSSLRQAFSTASTSPQTASSVAVPTHILKIELHPAELGMVTASLRLAGEQLSIELKPETHEAYRRLAADSAAIVKSLRGLGFDVDKVAILQPSIAVPTVARADASSSLPMSTGREQSAFQSGDPSGGNAGSGGQQPGRNYPNDAQEIGRAVSPARERTGDGMFI